MGTGEFTAGGNPAMDQQKPNNLPLVSKYDVPMFQTLRVQFEFCRRKQIKLKSTLFVRYPLATV